MRWRGMVPAAGWSSQVFSKLRTNDAAVAALYNRA